MPSDAENIIELLGPRDVIGQAVDLLMARNALSRDEAFELLVRHSSDSHRKVRESAADIIEQREGD
jgi:AmiR/NasT family two-component response regulator